MSEEPPLPPQWTPLASLALLLLAVAVQDGLLTDPVLEAIEHRLDHWPDRGADGHEAIALAHEHLFRILVDPGSQARLDALVAHRDRVEEAFGDDARKRLLADLFAVATLDGPLTFREARLVNHLRRS